MRTEAFAFGGLGGHFTLKGIRTIEEIIDAIGPEIDMHAKLHSSWNEVADGIIARAKKWGKPDAVILGGHSWGCRRTVEVASRLQAHHIDVDYIFGIDPTLLPPRAPAMMVPQNVKHVDEFHANSGIVDRGRSRNHGGKYVFTENWSGTRTLRVVKGSHVGIARSSVVRGKIHDYVAELLEKADVG